LDHRDAAVGLSRLSRAVCENVGERWRDGAGSLPDLGYRVTPMLAHKWTRAGGGADFGPSRNGDGTVPAVAHGLRDCEGVMARRRGQFADLGYPVTPMLAHKWTQAYDGADFGPSRNGDGTVPAVARSLREYGRAMARRRGQFADLGYPVTPMLARKLAQVVGATDFGPSRNGDGTEPAAARRLLECGRATARRRGQLADLGYPVTPMVAHMIAEHVTIARRLSDVGTKRIVPFSRCSGRTSIFHLNFSCSGCMRGVHHRGELRAVRTSARWSTRSIFNHRSCAGCRSQIARVPERHGVTRG